MDTLSFTELFTRLAFLRKSAGLSVFRSFAAALRLQPTGRSSQGRFCAARRARSTAAPVTHRWL
jgi:hypothetical protein